jgi:Holliday junction resolvase-like predicted endonuclease
MNSEAVTIIKRSGEAAEFDPSKLKHSLERSGATAEVIQDVIKKVKELLYDGISTQEIYRKAFAILRRSSRPTAARYKLKRALMELGPTGYPFEKFIAEMLRHEGFQTRVGVYVKGHCLKHEVDVIAQKKEKHFMIECKFHRDSGRRCDVKVPLYIQSRFLDLERQWLKNDKHETKFHQGWIFTNTRFTSDATQYGRCMNLMLVGWDYPHRGSLKERIDAAGLHPITSLTTLKKIEKQELLAKNVVLCMDLLHTPDILAQLGVSHRRQTKILGEADGLCQK